MAAESAGLSSGLSSREAELLDVTVELLAERGYERLTVEQVAVRARASKATVYRRWPSKAALVVAAVGRRMRPVEMPPDAGSLRADLLDLAIRSSAEIHEHGNLLAAVLPELRHRAELQAAVEDFLRHRRTEFRVIIDRAVGRGEVADDVARDDLWDVLFGYLTYRFLMPGRDIRPDTLSNLVDDLLLPGLRSSRDV
jgi:AcrR family transcriptional regulator